jgi:hypothetical protein
LIEDPDSVILACEFRVNECNQGDFMGHERLHCRLIFGRGSIFQLFEAFDVRGPAFVSAFDKSLP